VSARPPVRNWGAKANVALIFASIAAVLAVAALVTAFIIDPPALGWVGFAIASAVVVGLGVTATLVLPRMRVSAPRPAVAGDADRRLLLLQRRGVPATGSVGSDKPLESMTDALGTFPGTHVLLATPPAEESYWLERDLLAKARALTKLPITQATVASGRPAGPTGRQPAPAAAERSVSAERPRPTHEKERRS
jgi:hypothetical protein